MITVLKEVSLASPCRSSVLCPKPFVWQENPLRQPLPPRGLRHSGRRFYIGRGHKAGGPLIGALALCRLRRLRAEGFAERGHAIDLQQALIRGDDAQDHDGHDIGQARQQLRRHRPVFGLRDKAGQ